MDRACLETKLTWEKAGPEKIGINAIFELLDLALPEANPGLFSYMNKQVPHFCLSYFEWGFCHLELKDDRLS